MASHNKEEVDLKDVEMVEDSEPNEFPSTVIDPAAEARQVFCHRNTFYSLANNIDHRLVRKIDIRLMPTTALIYLLCYLDRSNIGKY